MLRSKRNRPTSVFSLSLTLIALAHLIAALPLASAGSDDELVTTEVVEADIDLDTLRDFAESGSSIDLRAINGGRPNDQIFIHTFTKLQSDIPKEEICGAKLATHIVPSTDSLTYTDTMGIRFYRKGSYRAVDTWGIALGEKFDGERIIEWWDIKRFPKGKTEQLNFNRLPISRSSRTENMVAMLASSDRIAFWVEDDTYVRSLAFKIDYCIDGKKTRSRLIKVKPPKGHEDSGERPVEIDESNPFKVTEATINGSGGSSDETARRLNGTDTSIYAPEGLLRGSITLDQFRDDGLLRRIRIEGEIGLAGDRGTGLFGVSYLDGRALVGGLFSCTPAYTLIQTNVGISSPASNNSGLKYSFVAIPAMLAYENRGFDGRRGSGIQSLQHGVGANIEYDLGRTVSLYGGVSVATAFTNPTVHSFFFGPENAAPIQISLENIPYFFRSQAGVNLWLSNSVAVNGSISFDQLHIKGQQSGKPVDISSSQTQVKIGTSIRIR